MTATLDELDALLARYRAAVEAMTSNLTELELAPMWHIVRAGGYVGATAAATEELERENHELWTAVGAFRQVVERAEAVRPMAHRRGSLSELSELLQDQSVVLAIEDVPLSARTLTGIAHAEVRSTLHDLLGWLETQFAWVRDALIRLHQVSAELPSRVDGVERTVARLPASHPARHEAAKALGDAAKLVALDPFGADELIDRIERRMNLISGALERADRRRAEIRLRLERATLLLRELDQRALEGRHARSLALKKAADAAVIDTVSAAVVTDLATRLTNLSNQLATVDISGQLDDWEAETTRARDRARRVLAHHRDLLSGAQP